MKWHQALVANVHRLGLTNVVVSGNPICLVGGLKYLKGQTVLGVAKKTQDNMYI